MKRIVGYGTGRCGTTSLAKFLSKQPGIAVTHEAKPNWHKLPEWIDEDPNELDVLILDDHHPNTMYCGDVAWYWTRLVPYIVDKYPDVYLINPWRDWCELYERFLRPTRTYAGEDAEEREITLTYWWQLEEQWCRQYDVFSYNLDDFNDSLDAILDFIEYDGERDTEIVWENKSS